MKVIKIIPQGYCKGVVLAIQIAKNTRIQFPHEKITILGQLVHNKYVTKALNHFNIETLENRKKTRLQLLDEIQEGIVIFTAHGVSPQVYKKAQDKGLKIIDATCSDVFKIHELIHQNLKEGKQIGYIGKKNHPESEAVLAISPQIHLIETADDIPANDGKPWLFTNQTTLSYYDTQELFQQIQNRFPDATIHNDICPATYMRQQALYNLEKVEALFVVGDPHSHNTQRLVSIGKKKIDHVYAIESYQDLKDIDFSQFTCCAVTSGASTPPYITQQVITALETNQIPDQIDYEKIL